MVCRRAAVQTGVTLVIGPNEAPGTGDTGRTVVDVYSPANQGRSGLGGGCAGAAAIVVALALVLALPEPGQTTPHVHRG